MSRRGRAPLVLVDRGRGPGRRFLRAVPGAATASGSSRRRPATRRSSRPRPASRTWCSWTWASRHGRRGGDAPAAGVERDADHRALRPRPGARQDRGPRRRGRRLPHQALRHRRAAGADPRGAAPRRARRGDGEPVVSVGEPARGPRGPPRVGAGDDEVRLTPTEFRLLAALAKNAGRVVTQRQLLKEVWGPRRGGADPLPARLHGASSATSSRRSPPGRGSWSPSPAWAIACRPPSEGRTAAGLALEYAPAQRSWHTRSSTGSGIIGRSAPSSAPG